MTICTDPTHANRDNRSEAVLLEEEDTLALAEDDAWAAVCGRDRRFDGAFVFAVKTTGIYCRPSCPARRPHRRHVEFFVSPRQAEARGYRACRRCHPQHGRRTPAEQAVEAARGYLDAHRDEQVTLATLAAHVELSPSHLQRAFKRLVGLSPKKYQEARRLEAFKGHAGKSRDVLEATYAAGFGSSRALYERAGTALGMTPGTYRRGGAGLAIRFTTLASPFGRILVAATERGLCAVSLGEDDASVETEIEIEFPNAASIDRDDAALRAWAEPVIRYLNGVHAHPMVPIDVEGTDFQRRVWLALQEIPYGETRSYSEVAERLGQPMAARAVARACASNKVALIIPCHRVVREDGTAGGYRWGVNRKQCLLEQERAGRSEADEKRTDTATS